MLERERTNTIIGAAIEVHATLGPGLLESAYEACLRHELGLRGLRVERQVPIPLVYKEQKLGFGYRADIVVEDVVLVELKTVEKIEPVHEAQLLTYLRLSGLRVGLLFNFHVERMKKGILRRVV